MVEYSEQKEMAKEVEIMQNDDYIEDEKCRNMVNNSEEFYRKHFACVTGMSWITFIVNGVKWINWNVDLQATHL